MSRSGQFGIVVFVLVIVLVLAVILLVIFLHGRDEPLHLDSGENKTLYNITVGSNAVSLVSYELSNGSVVLVRGSLFPNTIERYDVGVEANTTVVVSAFGEEYYFNASVCNVTVNDVPCVVGLKRKALNYTVSLTPTAVVIQPYGLTLQAPVALCFAEKSNVVNVVVDLPMMDVPSNLTTTYDFCFSVDQDISSPLVLPIDVHKNPFVNTTDMLKVLVRDFEVVGRENIGDRVAGVLV